MLKLLPKTFIFLFFNIVVYAQGGKAYLQTDRTIYAIGETMLGMVYIDNDNAVNKVVKIEVLDVSETLIFSCFSRINNEGIAEFYWPISFDLKTGAYLVRVNVADKYSTYDLCNGKVYLVNTITKWSDESFNDFVCDNTTNSSLKVLENLSISTLNVGITKVSFPTDIHIQKIISFELNDALFDHLPNVYTSSYLEEEFVKSWVDKIFLKGNIYSAGKAVKLNIIGVYSNQDEKFEIAKSNLDGQFVLELDDYTGLKSFQTFPYLKEIDKVEFTSKPLPIQNLKKLIVPDDKFQLYHQLASQRMEFHRYFGTGDFQQKVNYTTKLISLGEPQKMYIPSNYTKFKDIFEFCKENNTFLKFNLKDKKYEAQFAIPANITKKFGMISDNPLFIVNGFLTRNANAVAKLPIEEVEFMKFYYDLDLLKKTFSVFGNDGVVVIKTKTNVDVLTINEKSNAVELPGFQNMRDNPSIHQNYPMFSQTLSWLTNLKPNGQIEIKHKYDQYEKNVTALCKLTDGSIIICK